jgi:peptidoglycan hydrolase CwlO-like protein
MRDNLQQEIKTAENNILFFTSKSKTANKLVDDMQRKIDELKKQLADIQEKINQAED